MVATVTDNLSIKAYWSEARFAEPNANLSLDAVDADGDDATAIAITQGLLLSQEGETAVDAYNAASLTQAHLASALTAKSYRGLQASDDDDGSDLATSGGLNSLGVVASDHAGRKSDTPGAGTGLAIDNTGSIHFDLTASEIGSSGSVAAADLTGVDDSDRETFTEFTAEVDQSGGDVEVTVEASGRFFVMPVVEVAAVEDDAGTADVDETVEGVDEVVGREGLRDNPLTRIDFYASTGTFDIDGDDDTDETVLKYIGSVGGSAAGAQDYDGDLDDDDATTDNDSRKYIYTMTISESALADAVGSKGDYSGHEAVPTVVEGS